MHCIWRIIATNFKEVIKWFALNIILCMLLSDVCAIEPSYVIDLTSKYRFYVNRNGGISHSTFVVEKDNDKFLFKEYKEKLSMYDTRMDILNLL